MLTHPIAIKIAEKLADLLPNAPQRLLIGVSGGVDSLLLLQVVLAWQQNRSHAFPLLVIHVHHGLSPNADAWAQHVENFCQQHGLTCQIKRVKVEVKASLELAAREARMAAFAEELGDGDILLLAQHQNDQAETLLLRLLRGAGVHGLAAMQEWSKWSFSPVDAWIFRPLLSTSRADIEALAQTLALNPVQDESNGDTHYARNYVRHRILPPLVEKWPAAVALLSQTAERMREADDILQEVAEQLYQSFAQQQTLSAEHISIPALLSLSVAKQKLLLHYWLAKHQGQRVSEDFLRVLISELMMAKPDAQPELPMAKGSLRRYQRDLWYVEAPCELSKVGEWSIQQPWPYSPHKQLMCEKSPASISTLRLSHRQGGERFRFHDQDISRSVKKMLQSAHIPPWQREQALCIFSGEECIAVLTESWQCVHQDFHFCWQKK